jgi:hypothetical protein
MQGVRINDPVKLMIMTKSHYCYGHERKKKLIGAAESKRKPLCSYKLIIFLPRAIKLGHEGLRSNAAFPSPTST